MLVNVMRYVFAGILLSIGVVAFARGPAFRPDIRHIDFKNFWFPWDDTLAETPSGRNPLWYWIETPKSRIRLIKGLHHFYKPNESRLEHEHAPLISVDSATYGDLDGDGREEAAVHLNYSTGGTLNWDYLYVYRLLHGVPKLMAVLQGGSRADGGLVQITIQNGLLVLDFADPERRVGDCCSEGYIRVHYRWKDGDFVEEGPREKGDLPLRTR